MSPRRVSHVCNASGNFHLFSDKISVCFRLLKCQSFENFEPSQMHKKMHLVRKFQSHALCWKTSKTWFYKLPAARFSQINIFKSKVLKISRILKKNLNKKKILKMPEKLEIKMGKIKSC